MDYKTEKPEYMYEMHSLVFNREDHGFTFELVSKTIQLLDSHLHMKGMTPNTQESGLNEFPTR